MTTPGDTSMATLAEVETLTRGAAPAFSANPRCQPHHDLALSAYCALAAETRREAWP